MQKKMTVKLPTVYEEKDSLADYLFDPDNRIFNTSCYEVLDDYYDDKRISKSLRDKNILELYQSAYQVACNILNMKYNEAWGDVDEKNNIPYYILPDGSDMEKYGPNLNLFMPMLYYLLSHVEEKSIENEKRKSFRMIRKNVCARISLKFNSAPDETAIFDMFKRKFETVPIEVSNSSEPYNEEEVCSAIMRISECIGSNKSAWSGVVKALGDLEIERRYKAKHMKKRSNEYIKYLSDDVAEYLGKEKDDFYNNVRSAFHKDRSQIINKFKAMLEDERKRISTDKLS